MFKLLTKKSGKQTTKDIAVPLDISFASTSLSRDSAEAEEQAELKRKVLTYQVPLPPDTAGLRPPILANPAPPCSTSPADIVNRRPPI
eukprot:3365037-Rhodomonas_salina.1